MEIEEWRQRAGVGLCGMSLARKRGCLPPSDIYQHNWKCHGMPAPSSYNGVFCCPEPLGKIIHFETLSLSPLSRESPPLLRPDRAFSLFDYSKYYELWLSKSHLTTEQPLKCIDSYWYFPKSPVNIIAAFGIVLIHLALFTLVNYMSEWPFRGLTT